MFEILNEKKIFAQFTPIHKLHECDSHENDKYAIQKLNWKRCENNKHNASFKRHLANNQNHANLSKTTTQSRQYWCNYTDVIHRTNSHANYNHNLQVSLIDCD